MSKEYLRLQEQTNITDASVEAIDLVLDADSRAISIRLNETQTTSPFAIKDNSDVVVFHVHPEVATGVFIDATVDTITTGMGLQMNDGDALTTGGLASFVSDSSDTGTRVLVQITNDNTAATGAVCLSLQNDSTAGAAMSITGTGVLGIDMSALGVADSVLKATGTTDTTMKAPQTVAADEFLKIDIGGVAHYIPAYTVA
jgi:hypothetical protein